MDIVDFARYFGALALVLALVGLAALAARRYGVPGVAGGSAARRLTVVEALMIDPRYKVFLLRRDDREHLLVVGPNGASVVESGIAATSPAAQPAGDLPTIPPVRVAALERLQEMCASHFRPKARADKASSQ